MNLDKIFISIPVGVYYYRAILLFPVGYFIGNTLGIRGSNDTANVLGLNMTIELMHFLFDSPGLSNEDYCMKGHFKSFYI